MRKRNLLLTCAFSTCAFAQVSTGTSTFTRSYSFPPVGLASSETAQVNVVNIAAGSTAANATATTCAGTVTFANASGKTIGTPVSFTTTGSEVFSTQLTFSQLAATGTRGEFVASVQVAGSVAVRAQCSLVFSLETFDDTTGATHVYLGNSAASAVSSLVPVTFH
jgi:hypothetical protein